MARPDPRDNDSLTVVLQRMKDQLRALANRANIPVGKTWRVEEQAATGNLVATIPGLNRSVILASPNGECGAPLECVAAALDDTLVFDRDTNRLGAHISADTGNTLTTGEDGGLWVPGGSAAAGEAVFAGPFPLAPVTNDGEPVGNYDDEDHEGIWTYPEGEWAAPFIPGELASGFYNAGAWQQFGNQAYYDTSNAHPATGLSVRFPSYVAPSTTSTSGKYSGIAWYLQAWDEWYPPWTARPDWCGAYWEADFTYHFTGPTPLVANPSGGGSQYVPVCLFNMTPGASLYLVGRTLWGGAEASWSSTGMTNLMMFETSFPAYDPDTQTWDSRANGAYGIPYDTSGDPDYDYLIRFRVRLHRCGFSGIFIYIDHVDRPDAHYDSYISFGGKPLNFEQTQGSGLWFEFGPQFKPSRFPNPYVYPTPYPSFTMPEFYVSNISVKVALPDTVYWPPPPNDA